MADQIKLLLIALQFYTRLPITGRLSAWTRWSPDRLARATRYFPLAGIVVALLQSLVYVVASLLLPHPVALLLVLAVGLLLTGAFHEDGWADFCDGFGGHADRTRTLAIMRDSRIGTYGAAGLLLLLLLRFETLAHIDVEWIAAALVCAAALSRGCAVLVLASLPYAREEDDAKAKPIAESVRAGDVLPALALAGLPLFALTAWTGDATAASLGLAFALLATAALRRLIRRRLGGYTGDCLGAVQQVSEVAFLIGLLLALVVGVDAAAIRPADPS